MESHGTLRTWPPGARTRVSLASAACLTTTPPKRRNLPRHRKTKPIFPEISIFHPTNCRHALRPLLPPRLLPLPPLRPHIANHAQTSARRLHPANRHVLASCARPTTHPRSTARPSKWPCGRPSAFPAYLPEHAPPGRADPAVAQPCPAALHRAVGQRPAPSRSRDIAVSLRASTYAPPLVHKPQNRASTTRTAQHTRTEINVYAASHPQLQVCPLFIRYYLVLDRRLFI